MAFRQVLSQAPSELQNSVNSAYIITMTELENLTISSDTPCRSMARMLAVALKLRREIDEIGQSKLAGQGHEILRFQAGFRKEQG